MTTRISDSASVSEKSGTRLLESEQAMTPRAVSKKSVTNFETFVSTNEQCRNCMHCPLSSAFMADTTSHHSEDMN